MTKATIPVHEMPYLKLEDLAKLLGVSKNTVLSMPLPWAPLAPGSRTKVISRTDLEKYYIRQRGAVPE